MRPILRAVVFMTYLLIADVDACKLVYKNTVSCRFQVLCYDQIYINYDEVLRFGCGDNSIFQVTYKLSMKTFNTQSLKITYSYNGRPLNYIEELNLNGNYYSVTPNIPEMQNLKILTLEHNQLTEAKLYNEAPLHALEEINFSYNTINKLLVDNDMTPYDVFSGLKILNISNNHLVSLPDAIFDKFPALEKLDLSHNFIDTLGFMTFEGMKHLKILNLNNNRLAELNLALLRFKELEELYLCNNKLSDVTKRDFEKFTSLKILDLSNNLISKIERNTIPNLVMLNKFDISVNKLDTVDNDMFAHLINLQSINLSKNNLTSIPKLLFRDNKNISFLSVQGNALQGTITKGTFEGLKYIEELDLSFHKFTTLEDYAFFGLENLLTLLLNNNNLETISKNAFKSLRLLGQLDLSNNRITVIEFLNDDLMSLNYLSIKNNFINIIKQKDFKELIALNYIDISNNSVAHLMPGTFKSLSGLVNLEISKNPLAGSLEELTFDGLNSVPILDISQTLLTIIKNESFSGMTHLSNLNMSRCKIHELQYNSFLNAHSINILDVSFNELQIFEVNTTHLPNLQSLYLNNNNIVSLSSKSLISLSNLLNFVISHNNIKNISDDVFVNNNIISFLDISFNPKLNFNMKIFQRLHKLNKLILSGIEDNFNFIQVIDNNLMDLVISHSNVTNITSLALKNNKLLKSLDLTHNHVTKIDVGSFVGLSELQQLSLSFNQISFIQPGAFIENTLLYSLNVSHNNISNISYGMFRGLAHLTTVDLSFNQITSLRSERFYQVQSLTYLIADHNKIDYIGAEEFSGTNLETLSIGDNPLPCETLLKLKHDNDNVKFSVTALNIDHESENIDGVTCNRNNKNEDIYQTPVDLNLSDRFFNDFRIFFLNSSSIMKKSENVLESIHDVIMNITHKEAIPQSSIDETGHLASVMNFSKQIQLELMKKDDSLIEKINKTNSILNSIMLQLELIKINNSQYALAKETHNDSNSSLNKAKQESENTLIFVNEKFFELDNKIRELKSRLDNANRSQFSDKDLIKSSANRYQLTSNAAPASQSLFTETCVALILIVLICFILYSLFKSKVILPSRRSLSTREMINTMDSSNL